MDADWKFGPLPEVHPRHDQVARAKIELEEFVSSIRKKHSLTPSEEFMLLGEIVARLGNMCVISERRKGGVNG